MYFFRFGDKYLYEYEYQFSLPKSIGGITMKSSQNFWCLVEI
jgi:hypothetical protein